MGVGPPPVSLIRDLATLFGPPRTTDGLVPHSRSDSCEFKELSSPAREGARVCSIDTVCSIRDSDPGNCR
jgi:hypothetical protein